MNFKRVPLPKALLDVWQKEISSLNPKEVAQDILKISDHFKSITPVQTPWKDLASRNAYLAYFFPLNALRFRQVWSEVTHLNLIPENDVVLDYGSGPGTAHLIATLDSPGQIAKFICHDIDKDAISVHKNFCDQLPKIQTPEWSNASLSKDFIRKEKIKTVIFSYSLNELLKWPEWADECERLIILEPSTRRQGRKLQELRQVLINKGFHIWAPCTHQDLCPLLTHSKEDWCHNRIHIDKPEFLILLENSLPMRNDTLTYSYLLASRQPSPLAGKGLTRVIGDHLYEKGKSRQLICRNSEREFLAWLKREGSPPLIPRGSLLHLPPEVVKKSNEIRLSSPPKIE